MTKNKDFGGSYDNPDRQAFKMIGLIIVTIVFLAIIIVKG